MATRFPGPLPVYLLLLAGLQGACEQPQLRNALASTPAVSLVVVPGAVTLNTGDSTRFSGYVRDGNGDTSTVALDWRASGGTMLSNGTFVSDSPGTYRVIATAHGNPDAADTALVLVIIPSANLTGISVAPQDLVTEPDASTPFTAMGNLANGSQTFVAVNWATDGGVIDAGGTFTGGDSLGNFRVWAVTTDGRFSDTGTVTIQPRAPTLEQLTVTPPSASLSGGTTGATQQFTAIGLFDDSSSHPVSAAWAASAGTITSTGLYTARNVAAGTYKVVARAPNGLADSAQVTVTIPFVTRIAISPKTVSLNTKGTQQFKVTGFLSDGSTATVSASYTATGGTITSTGFYTAGSSGGSFRVIATTTSGGLADTATVNITAPQLTLTGLAVSPSPAPMLTGERLQFTAEAIYSDGSRTPVSPTWLVTGGSMGSGGVYTASMLAGSYKVIGQYNGKSDTVTVTANPISRLQKITLTPQTLGIPINGTFQFSTIGTLGTGGPVYVNVNYSASSGSITASGLYTAPGQTGSATVTARHVATGLQSVSAVTIGVSSCINEPPGLAAITDQPWDAVPPQAPATDQYGWRVGAGRTRLSIIQDNSARRSKPNVLQGKFPQGMGGGGGPFHIEHKLPAVKQLYQCFWLKIAPGFTNNGNSGTKLAFVYNTYQGTSLGSSAYLNLFGGVSDAGTMGVNTEGPGGFNRNMGTRFQWSSHLGEWHQFEFLMIANTQATADGVMHIWVDGAQDTYYTNVKWFLDQAVPTGFNHLDITPTYGGGHNPVPYDMFMYLDHWYVSGK